MIKILECELLSPQHLITFCKLFTKNSSSKEINQLLIGRITIILILLLSKKIEKLKVVLAKIF